MKKKRHSIKFLLAAMALLAGGLAQAQNLAWAKSMGGLDVEDGTDITVDAAGNVYSVGHFSGTADFDPGPGTCNFTNPNSIGQLDIYVSKLDASGNFVWAKAFDAKSGNTYSYTPSVSVAPNGDVLVAGIFRGTVDFDPGPGTFNLTTGMIFDLFIVRLTSAGNFIWAKQFSGASHQVLGGLEVDASGNVYTVGYFGDSTDFDPGPGVYRLGTPSGNFAAFVSKLDASGNFVWAKKLGGDDQQLGWGDMAKAVTLDAAGNLYVAGAFEGVEDFDPGPGVTTLSATVAFQSFIVKLDNNGNLVWARQAGSMTTNHYMRANAVEVNAAGLVYYGGDFMGTCDFDPGPGTTTMTSGANQNPFITCLDASGNFMWAKSFHGNGLTWMTMTLGPWGDIFVSGSFHDTIDFNPGPGVDTLITNFVQAYIVNLDASGNFSWVRTFRNGNTTAPGIASDANGNIYLTGALGDYWTVDFDPGAGVFNLPTAVGYSDVYVCKLSPSDLGAAEIRDGNALQLFPNPANEMVNVRGAENTTLQLLDVTGALVRTYALATTELRIDVSDLPNGMYLLVAETNEGRTVSKLQVSH